METDTDEAEAQFSEDCSPEIGLSQQTETETAIGRKEPVSTTLAVF